MGNPDLFENYLASVPPTLESDGFTVHLSGVLKAKESGVLSGLNNVMMLLIPESAASLRPYRAKTFVCQGSGYDRWVLSVDSTGQILGGRYSGNQVAGSWLPFNVSWSIPKR